MNAKKRKVRRIHLLPHFTRYPNTITIGALREEMIRDRIVGIRDAALLLKLQLMKTSKLKGSHNGGNSSHY